MSPDSMQHIVSGTRRTHGQLSLVEELSQFMNVD